MDIVVDLNILRGDKFLKTKEINYIIPLLLIIELLDSDSIQDDGKIYLLNKIKERNYIIDKRHPKTFFCNCIGQDNREQKVFDLFADEVLNLNETKTDKLKELIEWNKETELYFDKSFIEHDFSKALKLDIYRNYIKLKPENTNDLNLAIIKQIKKLLIEDFLLKNNLDSNTCKVTKSIDIYFSVLAYYHFFSATKGRPKHNDFTDINYTLYLDKDRLLYTFDKKLCNALKTINSELLFSDY